MSRPGEDRAVATGPDATRAVRELKGVGVWSPELRMGGDAEVAAAAAELEMLGYSALWLPQIDRTLFAAVERVLGATSTVTVATGILSVYEHEASEVADWWASLPDRYQHRLLLGLGVSHGPVVGEAYSSPLATMVGYLDGLDAGGVPVEARILAAQGPRMLELAGRRSAGAHPYLVTPEHTRTARAVVGPDALLAPEQGVVLESDSAVARELAREQLSRYCHLPNYVNNWLRLGFTEDDVAERSDRLVDALIAWGSVEDIARHIRRHFDAGADHVCIKVIQPLGGPMPLAQWRALSSALLSAS